MASCWAARPITGRCCWRKCRRDGGGVAPDRMAMLERMTALRAPRNGARRTPELDHAPHAGIVLRVAGRQGISPAAVRRRARSRRRPRNCCSPRAKRANASARLSCLRRVAGPDAIDGVNLRASAQTARATHPGVHALKDILPMIPGELISDYRIRLALEQEHADERRRGRDVGADGDHQCARCANPRLGTNSRPQPAAQRGHPVLNSVAAATRLTLEQVHAEQRRRLRPVQRRLSRDDGQIRRLISAARRLRAPSRVPTSPEYCAPSHTLTANAATDWRSACRVDLRQRVVGRVVHVEVVRAIEPGLENGHAELAQAFEVGAAAALRCRRVPA